MSNPLEAVWNTLKTTIDNINESPTPLHIIEAGDCWTYLTMVEEFLRYEEIGLNTTTDDEVGKCLRISLKHVNHIKKNLINL